MYAKKGSNLKITAVVLAIVLLIGCGIGGTIAWLKDASSIQNTFTTTGLTITLEEPRFDEDNAKMIPGAVITKDPIVTVKGNSEDCYVFVKIDTSNDFDSFMDYTVESNWKEITGVEDINGVYYRIVTSSSEDQSFSVLVNNQVTINKDLTKENMANIEKVTMDISAYAIQKAYLTDENDTPLDVDDIAKIWEMAKSNQAN